jgi:hypothetical protein
MAKGNSNSKIQTGLTKANLKRRCWAHGLTVTALASKIGKNRCTLYFAVENPTRYPVTFQLIQEALAE